MYITSPNVHYISQCTLHLPMYITSLNVHYISQFTLHLPLLKQNFGVNETLSLNRNFQITHLTKSSHYVQFVVGVKVLNLHYL